MPARLAEDRLRPGYIGQAGRAESLEGEHPGRGCDDCGYRAAIGEPEENRDHPQVAAARGHERARGERGGGYGGQSTRDRRAQRAERRPPSGTRRTRWFHAHAGHTSTT